MTSGTLTYHSGYNYGASLQAYALQTVIIRECGENEIINFEPFGFLHSREMLTKHPRRLKEVIKLVSRLGYAGDLGRRQRLFDDFGREQLRTTKVCRTRDEAIGAAKRYDCIVCGSDQIWNLGAPGDEFAANTLFFLDFPKAQRRVSYAASFGGWVKDAGSRSDEIRSWLQEFDAVSVREDSGKRFLDELGIPSRVDVDPTLLLDADDYRKIARDPGGLPERYVLLFSWAVGKSMIEVAKRASKYYGVPVINIVPPPRAMFSGVKRKLDVGPREFLHLVDNAEFIVTGSFHGTVFSSIFEKRFASVYDGASPDTRMASILDHLGLGGRLVASRQVDDEYFRNLDDSVFSDTAQRLEALRADSIEYIRQNVRA